MQNSSITLLDSDIRIDTRNFKVSHGFPEDNNGFIITVYKDRVPVRRIINIGDGVLSHYTIVTKTNPVENLRYALSTIEPGVPTVVLTTSCHTGYMERKTEPNHGILSAHKIDPLLKTLEESGYLDDVENVYVTARHLENLAIPGQMIVDKTELLAKEWREKRKADDVHPDMVEIWEAAIKDPGVIRAAITDLYGEFDVPIGKSLEDIRTRDAEYAAMRYGKNLTVVKTPTVVAGDLKFADGRDPFEYVAS